MIKVIIKRITPEGIDISGEESSDILDISHSEYIKYNDNIAGMGTLFIEDKIIHNFGKVGHIEDIVIDKQYRKLGLGKKLILFLKNKANENKCYKVILNCDNHKIPFYIKCGFIRENNQMVVRL